MSTRPPRPPLTLDLAEPDGDPPEELVALFEPTMPSEIFGVPDVVNELIKRGAYGEAADTLRSGGYPTWDHILAGLEIQAGNPNSAVHRLQHGKSLPGLWNLACALVRLNRLHAALEQLERLASRTELRPWQQQAARALCEHTGRPVPKWAAAGAEEEEPSRLPRPPLRSDPAGPAGEPPEALVLLFVPVLPWEIRGVPDEINALTARGEYAAAARELRPKAHSVSPYIVGALEIFAGNLAEAVRLLGPRPPVGFPLWNLACARVRLNQLELARRQLEWLATDPKLEDWQRKAARALYGELGEPPPEWTTVREDAALSPSPIRRPPVAPEAALAAGEPSPALVALFVPRVFAAIRGAPEVNVLIERGEYRAAAQAYWSHDPRPDCAIIAGLEILAGNPSEAVRLSCRERFTQGTAWNIACALVRLDRLQLAADQVEWLASQTELFEWQRRAARQLFEALGRDVPIWAAAAAEADPSATPRPSVPTDAQEPIGAPPASLVTLFVPIVPSQIRGAPEEVGEMLDRGDYASAAAALHDTTISRSIVAGFEILADNAPEAVRVLTYAGSSLPTAWNLACALIRLNRLELAAEQVDWLASQTELFEWQRRAARGHVGRSGVTASA